MLGAFLDGRLALIFNHLLYLEPDCVDSPSSLHIYTETSDGAYIASPSADTTWEPRHGERWMRPQREHHADQRACLGTSARATLWGSITTFHLTAIFAGPLPPILQEDTGALGRTSSTHPPTHGLKQGGKAGELSHVWLLVRVYHLPSGVVGDAISIPVFLLEPGARFMAQWPRKPGRSRA